ncbi:hypothetical protein T10_2695, partial [Trichinella papuae]
LPDRQFKAITKLSGSLSNARKECTSAINIDILCCKVRNCFWKQYCRKLLAVEILINKLETIKKETVLNLLFDKTGIYKGLNDKGNRQS